MVYRTFFVIIYYLVIILYIYYLNFGLTSYRGHFCVFHRFTSLKVKQLFSGIWGRDQLIWWFPKHILRSHLSYYLRDLVDCIASYEYINEINQNLLQNLIKYFAIIYNYWFINKKPCYQKHSRVLMFNINPRFNWTYSNYYNYKRK